MNQKFLLSFGFFLFFTPSFAQAEIDPLPSLIAEARKNVVEMYVESPIENPLIVYGEKQRSAGSGFFIQSAYATPEELFLVTNQHVIDGATSISIRLFDGSRVSTRGDGVRVLGIDLELDIALLSVRKASLAKTLLQEIKGLTFADLREMTPGMKVFALGNAFALSTRPSEGIFAGMNVYLGDEYGQFSFNARAYNTRTLYVDTTAAINPGNSGGPLLNFKGRVIAVNAIGIKESQSFAASIPSHIAKRSLDRIAQEIPLRMYSGLSIQPVFSSDRPNLPGRSGVKIAFVQHDSPAHEAGLMPGDIVIAISGEAVNVAGRDTFGNYVRFWELLEDLPRAGSLIPIEYVRSSVGPALQKTYVYGLPTGYPTKPVYICKSWGLAVRDVSKSDTLPLQTSQHHCGVIVVGRAFNRLSYKAIMNWYGLQNSKEFLSRVWINRASYSISGVADFRELCPVADSEESENVIFEVWDAAGPKYYKPWAEK